MSGRAGKDLCVDILRALGAVQHHISGLDRQGFVLAHTVQDAVVYRLMIIGEAGGDLYDFHKPAVMLADPSGELLQLLRDYRRMRDLLIHYHWKLDPLIVWQAIEDDFPALDAGMRALLPTI